MKHLFQLFICVIFFSACSKSTSDAMLDEMVAGTAVLKFSGQFMNGPYGSGMGKVKIFETSGKYQLKLEEFSVSAGPDLKVYLSEAATPGAFINLGDLKSTNGNQVYDINGVPDFSKYKYVLIHCQQFNHLFLSAPLN